MGVNKEQKVRTLTESIYSNGKKPCRISVQKHTSFIIEANGRRTWRFRAKNRNIDIDTNFAPSGDMSKDKAMFAEWSHLVKQGIHPQTEFRKISITPSFREVAEDHIANGLGHITNAKNEAQFASTLRTYVYPALGALPVDQITPRHIYECLKDIWYGNLEKGIDARQETASRTLQRIGKVFGRAIALGYVQGANPAIYKGNLDALLLHTRKQGRFKSIHYREIPKLFAELQEDDSIPSLALMWIAANVTRTGEALKATYDQFEPNVWTIPSKNTKTRKDFQVPLTAYSRALLGKINRHSLGGSFLFPSPTKVFQPISDTSLRNRIAKLDTQGWSKHGFRATFKTWAEEQTQAKNAVIESCLAHTTQGVEKHYMRGDYLELRRDLMERWHQHLEIDL